MLCRKNFSLKTVISCRLFQVTLTRGNSSFYCVREICKITAAAMSEITTVAHTQNVFLKLLSKKQWRF